VSQKKNCATFIFTVTLANVGRFFSFNVGIKVLVLQSSNKVKQQWENFHSCYEPFLSDTDIERILKIDQHLPKLQ